MAWCKNPIKIDNYVKIAITESVLRRSPTEKTILRRQGDWMSLLVQHCGYAYLTEKFNLRCLSLTSTAQISTGVNKLVRLPGQLLVPPRMAPAPADVLGHLVFALKHEGVNLEMLAQVRPSVDAAVLQKAQRQIIQARMVRFTISVSVSLFSMRLLTPQQKALKIILLRNSVQTM